jgi:hypothetical protein
MQFSPGSLVQYRVSGSFLLPWPAVICTDDMAPNGVARIRPHGYVTLVLLMGANLEL